MMKFLMGGLVVMTACATEPPQSDAVSSQDLKDHEGAHIPNDFPILNPSGLAATVDVNDDDVNLDGPFFQSFGTNGRVCATCHEPTDGWTVVPSHIELRFDATGGTDPIFRIVDGANNPNDDVSTVKARRKAYNMLLTKGLIRVGIGVPSNAQFDLSNVDDPYHYASAAQLSLFRRPLPSANLDFLSTVMWDGRETLVDSASPPAADSDCLKYPFPAKCFDSLDFELGDQANGATLGHAQATMGLSPPLDAAIVQFETSLYFAQQLDFGAGPLDIQGATGGPDNVPSADAYFGENDNFGDYRTGAAFSPVIFTTYDAWSGSHDKHRASIARGEALFNSKAITLTGVGGLNGLKDPSGNTVLPASFQGTCGTCHNAQGAGNHTIPAPLNIGIADASRRTSDMPLYTFKCNPAGAAAGVCHAGDTVQSTDPGRALITGNWVDIGRFKGPTLRGLAARAPYFHNGSAKDLDAVVDFYDQRFGIGFTKQEHEDLVNFLASL